MAINRKTFSKATACYSVKQIYEHGKGQANRMKITIARQCGSGGHEVAEALAEKLNLEIFDKKRFVEEAKKRNVYDENANFLNEKPIDSFLYSIAMNYGATNPRDRYIDFVKELTEQENCIIIGRCANHIYKDDKDCVSVYLHADKEIRCKRLQKRDQISEKEALKNIQEVDEKRTAFQEQCTSTRWGDGNEYDLCIDTGKIGISHAVQMILEYIQFKN